MIRSDKLTNFFRRYEARPCLNLITEIFGLTYVKTRGDDGIYCWVGVNRSEFDQDMYIDEFSPSVDVAYATCVFIRHTEDQVIEKFTRYQKLKAFL